MKKFLLTLALLAGVAAPAQAQFQLSWYEPKLSPQVSVSVRPIEFLQRKHALWLEADVRIVAYTGGTERWREVVRVRFPAREQVGLGYFEPQRLTMPNWFITGACEALGEVQINGWTIYVPGFQILSWASLPDGTRDLATMQSVVESKSLPQLARGLSAMYHTDYNHNGPGAPSPDLVIAAPAP